MRIEDRRLLAFARHNRSHMNDAEVRLWFELRRSITGHRFRRQHVVGRYIVDFVCVSARLVVEVDGSQHIDSAYDGRRDAYLRASGFDVLRVPSWDVLRDIDRVLVAIRDALSEPRSA